MKPAILQRLSALEARHNESTSSHDYLAALDEGQRAWVERFTAAPGGSTTVWEIARQRGKSYAALALLCDFASKTPGALVRYCALTRDSAYGIAQPILGQLLEGCPKSERPELSSMVDEEGIPGPRVLTWPRTNGKLFVFGTDSQSFRKGRGPRTHIQAFEEAGFYMDFESTERALLPALQTTGGKALYLSSPPESIGHPFIERARIARAQGRFEHDTFWSNPRINHDAIIQGEMERLGLTREQLLISTYFRREYLAEEVGEESRAAVPTWNAALEGRVTKALERPRFFSSYVSVDWGGHEGDPHAALFAYYDFPTGKLVIEEEFERNGGTLTELAFAWKETERRLWGVDKWEGTLLGAGGFDKDTKGLPGFLKRAISDAAPSQPYLRVSDHNDGFQSELLLQHGYALLPTDKHDPGKHAMIDRVGSWLAAERIIIHPRVKRLREQLYTTLWDKERKRWERTSKDHGDLLDCLSYMVRHVKANRDPRPAIDSFMTTERPKKSGWAGLGGRRVTRY